MVEPLQPLDSLRARILDDVVCGINGSRASYEAVRQAAVLAGADARLTLVAVTAVRGAGSQRTASIAPERARQALLYARRLAVKAGVEDVTVEIDDGYPVVQTLLEHARAHGLLAIGAPFMSRMAHLLVGGTATQAAHLLSSDERPSTSDSQSASSLRATAVPRPTPSLTSSPNWRLSATPHWCSFTRFAGSRKTSSRR